jgi:hypothetical protein
MKSKNYIKFGFLSGLIPLIIGWLIFLLWLLARELYATDLDKLVLYGIIWLYISFPVAIIGLITTIIFLKDNYPKYKGISIGTIILILVNIPSVILIIITQLVIDSRAYIKITNQSEQELQNISLIRSDFKINLSKLNDSENTIVKYYPKYIYPPGETEYFSGVEVVSIVIQRGVFNDTIKLPDIYEGNCKHYIINKEYKLIETYANR